ncbi:hypothetical protein CMO89_03705 [Candidatus Woesearchaeota archaeon]|nr:hypothetical protein [Candidatus Woesearchaeota archaeon]
MRIKTKISNIWYLRYIGNLNPNLIKPRKLINNAIRSVINFPSAIENRKLSSYLKISILK